MSGSDINKLYSLLLIIKSFTEWGSSQNLSTSIQHIIDECYELNNAIHLDDYSQYVDEISDIIITVLFLVSFVEESFGISLNEIINNGYIKLFNRYQCILHSHSPQLSLFPAKSYMMPEEKRYNRNKYISNLRVFSYCANKKCISYLMPGIESISVTIYSNNNYAVLCNECDSSFRINESVIFPYAKISRFIILNCIYHLIKNDNIRFSASYFGVSSKTIVRWLSSDKRSLIALANLISRRFNLNEQKVLQKILSYRR